MSFKLDFIGIGAEKSATYWLSDCLSEHPEICIPKTKEIFFFNEYDPHFFRVKNLKYQRGVSWLKTLFDNCKKGNLKGEFSPTYIYCPTAAKRIKKHFPNTKIIACLRNPVDRAFSQYLHYKRLGRIGNISFEESVRRNDIYFIKGLYYEHLKKYYDLFPKKNIYVLIYDDLKNNPKTEIKKLYRFLGVDTGFVPPSINKKTNTQGQARFPLINYVAVHTEYFIRDRGWDSLLKILETFGIRRLVFNFVHFVNKKPVKSYPKLPANVANSFRKKYTEDIKKLEKLIKRDLSFWISS